MCVCVREGERDNEKQNITRLVSGDLHISRILEGGGGCSRAAGTAVAGVAACGGKRVLAHAGRRVRRVWAMATVVRLQEKGYMQ